MRVMVEESIGAVIVQWGSETGVVPERDVLDKIVLARRKRRRHPSRPSWRRASHRYLPIVNDQKRVLGVSGPTRPEAVSGFFSIKDSARVRP